MNFWETFAGGGLLLAIYLVLKLIFGFIEKAMERRNGNDVSRQSNGYSNYQLQKRLETLDDLENVDLKEQERYIHELWMWHNEKDDDGVFRWYIRKSLEENIKMQGHALNELTKTLQQLALNTSHNTQVLNKLVALLTKSRNND